MLAREGEKEKEKYEDFEKVKVQIVFFNLFFIILFFIFFYFYVVK